jgi:hypothetical protein
MGAWEAQSAPLPRPEVIVVQEMLISIQAEDVYEPPLLAEVGEYRDLTQGGFGFFFPEGFALYWE